MVEDVFTHLFLIAIEIAHKTKKQNIRKNIINPG
jgi:hypothetical protein